MKILIAGAGGFIGSRAVAELRRRGGHDLNGLSRRPREGGDLTWVVGDVTDPDSLVRATRGVDCVLHSLQFPNHPVENPRKGWTYLKVDGAGTRNMVAACVRNGVRRFVYLSGAGVEADRPEPWFRAKVIAERAVRESGMEWVILRPSWVYGPGDHSLNKFAFFTRHLPLIPVIGDGRARSQPVHVDDVAAAAAAAVDLAAATGRVFELGGPETLTINEVMLAVQRALGKRRPLVHFPAWFMKAAAAPLLLLPTPPLSPAAVDFLLMDTVVDPGPAAAVFGIRFRSLDEGLAHLRQSGGDRKD